MINNKQIVLKQYFRQEDGVYMQYFANHTENIEWKHNVAFKLQNMKVRGLYQKQRIECIVYPGDEQLILICQEGGKDYLLGGGVGTCDFEILNQNYINVIDT